jgi:tyrosyl-tRNA synthetase
MKPLDIKEQVEILKRGSAGVIPEGGLEQKLEHSRQTGKPLRIKLGLDPTAPDIHLGSAVVLRKLRQFQDMGHEVIVIIGDFTAMIGDPSGKSETRKQLTTEEVKINAATYEAQYHKILNPAKTSVRFNSEWLGKMSFFDVINLASRMTVARIMERDDFANRFREGRPIGLHELLYPLCQAYDSVVLQADIEMGGTDQMFNILAGRDLQTQYGQAPQTALFTPLLVGLDGVQKMSKSLGNYVGITESPSSMFGKLMSISDETMKVYFELATETPMREVNNLLASCASGELNPKEVKRRLAREIVSIYHSPEDAIKADEEFERVHAHHENPEDVPDGTIPAEIIKDGKIWICRLLAALQLAKGTGEARRLIEQGGVKIEGQKISNASAEYTPEELKGKILQVGSRSFVRIN